MSFVVKQLEASAPARPVLRHYGGKWRLAPWVLRFIPQHEKYLEPYCGAASILLLKARCFSEVINDLNSEVCNLFAVLRDEAQAEQLAGACWLTPFSREEFQRAYATCEASPVERARRLVVRSFMGYNAVSCHRPTQTAFRTRLSEGRYSPAMNWATYPASLRAVTERLRGVIVENLPALKTIELYDSPGTVIYCDPPYLKASRRPSSRAAYLHEMSDADHVELAQALHRARGMVLLSGYASPLYDELYCGWRRFERAANSDGSGARQRTECLWLNPAAQAAYERDRAQLRLI